MRKNTTKRVGALSAQDCDELPTRSRVGAVTIPRHAYEETPLDRLCYHGRDDGLAPIVDGSGRFVTSVPWDVERGAPVEAVPPEGWCP